MGLKRASMKNVNQINWRSVAYQQFDWAFANPPTAWSMLLQNGT